MHLYLWKRKNTFYYRIKIPSDLSYLFPSKLIRISLKTNHLDAAKVAAASLNSKIQSLFALLRTGTVNQEQIQGLIASYLPCKQSFKVVATKEQDAVSVKLSEAISMFVSDKGVRWSHKTMLEFSCMFDVLLQVIGDVDAPELKRADGLKCRDSLMRLPANFRKKKKYRNISIKQILESDAEQTLTPKTINWERVMISPCMLVNSKSGAIGRSLSAPSVASAGAVKVPVPERRK